LLPWLRLFGYDHWIDQGKTLHVNKKVEGKKIMCWLDLDVELKLNRSTTVLRTCGV
jgi:hypothetical protein